MSLIGRINSMIMPKHRFNVGMFPHLKLVNRMLQSKELFNGTAIRECAWSRYWQPYMDKEGSEWYKPIALKYIRSKIPQLAGDLRISHGISPEQLEKQEAILDMRERLFRKGGTENEWDT